MLYAADWAIPCAWLSPGAGRNLYRMAVALISLFADTRVETPADIQRGFHALFGMDIDYNPLHSQLSKRRYVDLMRAVARQVLDTLVVRR